MEEIVLGGEYIQHYNPFTSHRESTGTSTNMSVTPRGLCTVTLPAMAGQPAPISCAAVAHLSSLPLHVSSETESLSQAGSRESSPTTSPWQPQLQRSPSTSYANEKRPQMSAVTTSPFPSLLNFLLKVTAVHSSYFAFSNTFHGLMDGNAT